MNPREIKRYSKDWYTLGRNFLPEFDNIAFARLAGQSTSFCYEVVGKTDKNIKVRVSGDCQTAYVDLSKSEITISANYFKSELYEKRYEVEGKAQVEQLAISLINGSVIHEALHIKYTNVPGDKTIPDALKLTSKSPDVIRKFGLKTACLAFNIIEDLFIESHVPMNLERWLQATSDILFPKSSLKREWNVSELKDYLYLAIAYKNKEHRDEPEFENFSEDTLRILERASALSSFSPLATRANLAMDFLNAFEMPEPEFGEGEDEESIEGEGEEEKSTEEDGESTEGEGSGADSEIGEDDWKEGEVETTSAVPGASEEVKELLDELEDIDTEELERIAKEVKDASDEVVKEESKTEEFISIDGMKLSWKKLVEQDIVDRRRDGKSVYPYSTINFSFLKKLVAIRTANRTPGAARKSGSVMVKSRLTRIATDGKIFAKQDSERKTLKRLEVIINIDFSGSTNGPVINNELGSAKQMSKVLRSAGIAHSVYGHTSTRDRDIPYLFHIFSYDMEITNKDFDARFEAAEYVTLAENYDGVVINRLGEKFTEKQGSKFLINLSDGTPAGPGYYNPYSGSHTKGEIKKLRDQGIGVFAISVVSHVVSQNDKIYGKDFNIDGSKNTSQQFQRLIIKLAS